MTIYTIINKETGCQEGFVRLTKAKKARREHNAKGFKTRVTQTATGRQQGKSDLEVVIKDSSQAQE